MLKKLQMLCITLVGTFLAVSTTVVHAGFVPSISDVQAIDSDGNVYNATAAHGVFTGNNTGSGDPLLTLLNFGTSTGADAELKKADGTLVDILISSTGMFSTDAKITPALAIADGNLVDLIDGDPVALEDGDDWISLGTTNANEVGNSGPFEDFSGTTSGDLTLKASISPLSGNLVIALKAGDYYAVYAFANAVDIESFTFTSFSILNIKKNGTTQEQTPALSHASLYVAPPSGPDTDNLVPEPASMALFGLGALGMGLIARRRRSTNEAAV